MNKHRGKLGRGQSLVEYYVKMHWHEKRLSYMCVVGKGCNLKL